MSGGRLGLRQRIEHAQCLALEDLHASQSSVSPARCSSRTLRPTATSPSDSSVRPARRGVRVLWVPLPASPHLANGTTRRSRSSTAGSRAAVTRTIDERPGWRMEEMLTVRGRALHATTVAAGVARGRRRRARACSCRASRTSSSSRATPLHVLHRARVGRSSRNDGRRRRVHNPRRGERAHRPQEAEVISSTRRVRPARLGYAAIYEILVERCGLGRQTRARGRPRYGPASRRLLISEGRVLARAGPGARRSWAWRTRSAHVPKCGSLRSRTPSRQRPTSTWPRCIVVSLGGRGGRGHEAFEAPRPAGSPRRLGEPDRPDAFISATSPLLGDLEASPTRGGVAPGPAHALDSEARLERCSRLDSKAPNTSSRAGKHSGTPTGFEPSIEPFSPIAWLDETRRSEDLRRRRTHRRGRVRRRVHRAGHLPLYRPPSAVVRPPASPHG